MADFDACVIGAGAVGLAIGRALAVRGASVVVLEQHARFGEETSSRNSEVIHAGLYYPPGSLKARFCVEGKRAIYAYGAQRGFRAEAIGKLIVAADASEFGALESLAQKGVQNDVDGLTLLDRAGAKALEPNLTCFAALHSATSGLVDSHLYMLSLLGEIEDSGGALARQCAFEHAIADDEGWRVRAGGDDFVVRVLINSAGLWASHAARQIEGLVPVHIPQTRYAKGSYFRYAGKMPFSRLIYPAPSVAGHGVHYTPMADGRGRFGPDFEMIREPEYEVDASRAVEFAAGIARYWPQVELDRLLADYAGVRPKIGCAPATFEDFRIDGPPQHGLEGLICLFGIDSPGLTSSFALGDYVAELALG
ncbi:MAG: NAD(P)/FAD-dependent oxidoreductase [Caulobacterales bacterium]|jgi:L-2-hydroxyglutarate oxidase LhgO